MLIIGLLVVFYSNFWQVNLIFDACEFLGLKNSEISRRLSLFFSFAGYAPFTAPTTEELWVNIVNWKDVLRRPHYDGKDSEFNINDTAWDIIKGLISGKDQRISKLSDVQKHPYFEGFDWENLRDVKVIQVIGIKCRYLFFLLFSHAYFYPIRLMTNLFYFFRPSLCPS